MGGITAKEANQLQAGDKVKVGPGLYLRRNTDDTLTCWGRLKVAGRSVDVQCGRESLPISSAGLKSLLTEGASARHEHSKRKPLPKAVTAGTVTLTKNSPLGDVWRVMLADIDANGKWTPTNRKASLNRVARYLEPSPLWKTPVPEIRPLDAANLLAQLSSVPGQRVKVRSLLSLVFDFALGAGLIEFNAAREAGRIARVTSKRTPKKHHPTSVDPEFLRQLYKRIQNSESGPAVRQALQLQALTCQRSGEVVGAEWSEFDLDKATWTIPRCRMKIKDEDRGPHRVPLSRAAVTLLRSMHRKDGYVFPGRRKGNHVSANALPKMFREELGLAKVFVPHSWRSAFRTTATSAANADGQPLFSGSWLESALDHGKLDEDGEADKLGRSYERGGHTEGARRALEWWAGQICGGEA